MSTEPTDQPEQDPTAEERFLFILQSLREEGGATKENLILVVMGYVSRAIDRMQERLPQANKLPLTDEQVRIAHYVMMDTAINAARFAAKLAVNGEPVTEWAEITNEEAHQMTHAVLSGMVSPHQPQPAKESTHDDSAPSDPSRN